MSKICIVGAGGHTRSLMRLLECNAYAIEGIYDDNFQEDEEINGYKVLGPMADLKADLKVIVSVGDNQKREKLHHLLKSQLFIENLIHPKAFIDERVEMGTCNQIFANVCVNTNVKIGTDNILNSGCIIEHEVVMGSHNHISVGSIICGRATIEDRCFVGAGAVIIDKVNICSDVVIGANSTVIQDISEPGTYVGSPARKIKLNH